MTNHTPEFLELRELAAGHPFTVDPRGTVVNQLYHLLSAYDARRQEITTLKAELAEEKTRGNRLEVDGFSWRDALREDNTALAEKLEGARALLVVAADSERAIRATNATLTARVGELEAERDRRVADVTFFEDAHREAAEQLGITADRLQASEAREARLRAALEKIASINIVDGRRRHLQEDEWSSEQVDGPFATIARTALSQSTTSHGKEVG